MTTLQKVYYATSERLCKNVKQTTSQTNIQSISSTRIDKYTSFKIYMYNQSLFQSISRLIFKRSTIIAQMKLYPWYIITHLNVCSGILYFYSQNNTTKAYFTVCFLFSIPVLFISEINNSLKS